MKCTPKNVNYHVHNKCNSECPYWQGCLKELELPKNFSDKWIEVEITSKESKKRPHHVKNVEVCWNLTEKRYYIWKKI